MAFNKPLEPKEKKQIFDFWVSEANKHLKNFSKKNKTRANNPNDYKEAMDSLNKMNYCFMKAVGLSTSEANFLLTQFRNLDLKKKNFNKRVAPRPDWYDDYLKESELVSKKEKEKQNITYTDEEMKQIFDNVDL